MNQGSPLTVAALQYFATADGRRLISCAEELEHETPWRAQETLRKAHSADLARAALAVAEQRRRAADKFPATAERMFFDREGLEMASRAEIAAYRAQRIGPSDSIADLCCGAGADAVALAAHSPVVGVDIDAPRLLMSRLNAQAMNVDNRLSLVRGDSAQVPLRGMEALFADPARRRDGRRVRSPGAYEPSLDKLISLCSTLPKAAVKVAPAIPYDELPAGTETEFISSAGQCREAVLYFGDLVTTCRRATILPGPHSLCVDDGCGEAPVAEPGAYLFDPDPAVVRAHLIDALAQRMGAWKLDPQIAYLSSAVASHTPFARCYRVIEKMPFHLDKLRKILRERGMVPGVIKKRRFPLDADELWRLLRGKRHDPGNEVTLIFTRLDGNATVFICDCVLN